MVDEAAAAFKAQYAARYAAISATTRLRIALDNMTRLGATLIQEIRAKASKDGSGVYPKAFLDPPSARAPLPPPGKPTNLKVELGGIGELTLKWKCKNPRGAGPMYQIWRRIVTDGKRGERTFIGAIGKKRFVDETLPAGTAQVIYEIQAFRPTAVGPVATFPVNFGTDGSERLPTFVPKGEAAKIVA